MRVLFVLTEHRAGLTGARARVYERTRRRLEQVAGTEVAAEQYEGVERLQGADAVVLSGSFEPWSSHDPDALARLGDLVRGFDGPLLGICAGMQLQALFAGGSVARAPAPVATGFAPVDVVEADGLLRGLPPRISVYHHHGDEITSLPDGFRALARSATCGVEAIGDAERRWWGTQFHPEAYSPEHPHGERVLRNFFELAGVS